MKAVVCTKSGPPEVLQYKDVEKPAPRRGELLIKVHCATVTSGDVRMRRFPRAVIWVVGAIFGFKPMSIPGIEYAGKVVEIGDGVDRFAVGDTVCGTTTGLRHGANAEYVCVPSRPKHGVLVRKPENVEYSKAASVIVGAMTAFYLLERGEIGKRKRVLVYGASGSVGSYAVQLAKHFGVGVTGVCSTANVKLVKSIGADRVIDYTVEDFTKQDTQYDLIFDAVGKIHRSGCKRVLAADGYFTSIRRPTKEEDDKLQYLLELVAAGKIRPVIDKEYSLEEVIEAHRYVESGRKRGNVIVRVTDGVQIRR